MTLSYRRELLGLDQLVADADRLLGELKTVPEWVRA
jgi:hypothetical protein